MTALPADVARYTREGIVVSFNAPVLKEEHPNAVDDGEIRSFFRYAADAQAMLDERVELTAVAGALHEAIEVRETLGIGTIVPITPTVPCWRVIDETRGLNDIGRTRAVSFDMNTDRYSLELVG